MTETVTKEHVTKEHVTKEHVTTDHILMPHCAIFQRLVVLYNGDMIWTLGSLYVHTAVVLSHVWVLTIWQSETQYATISSKNLCDCNYRRELH